MARRLPPLSALRPFEAAARLESFTRAAEELHLTHGAVSHQVRALEEHVGTPLFARNGKRVALTAAGRTFAERVRGALEELEKASDSIRVRRDDRLTVSVLPSFASRWLMPRLIRFMEKNPKLEVNVMASQSLTNFRDDEVDIAIRFGTGPWAGLVCELFLDDEYFVVGSPTRFPKSPRTPRELLGLGIIREDRDYWKEWFDQAGVAMEEVRQARAPTFSDSTYALQAAARGEGIALARKSIAYEDIERGALRQLFEVRVPSRERYWFVSPKETAESQKVKLFRDWVRAELSASKTMRPLLRRA